MGETIHIRPARQEDLGVVAALWRELDWLPSLRVLPQERLQEAMAQRLAQCQASGDHVVLVAQGDDGEVLGYAAMHYLPYLMLPGPEAYVSELFVTAAARGRGVGKLLLGHLEELARDKGCARLMLFNGRDRESYAREFYKKQGWQERPVIANFVRNLMEF